MNNEEDYYTKRTKKSDAAFFYIMWAGLAFLSVFAVTKLFSYL